MRIRVKCARTVSPSSGSVRSRKSSSPRRQTTSGAITRPFGVKSSASHDSGEVEEEVELSWERFNELPRSSTQQDIHCVTRWSRFDAQFSGVHWRELARLCRPLPSARFVIAHAEHGFTANVPLASLEDE